MSLNGLFLSFSALCDLKNTFFRKKNQIFFLKKFFFPNFSNSCSLNIFEPKIWRRLGTFPSCLLLMYIDDLPDCIPESRSELFEDDISPYNFVPNRNDEICNDVKTARRWFKDNKLTINTDKCESLGFGTSEPFPFEAFAADIRSLTHCEYLGV